MAIKIRLKRMGTKKKPVYRIVATNNKSARDGSVTEELGTYNPTLPSGGIKLNKERIRYWLDCGAIASKTVVGILKKEDIK